MEIVITPTQDNIINKDQRSLKDDIIYFKEELLKQMNVLEKSLSQQKEEIRAKLNSKFILYDETIEKLNTNLSELKNIVKVNKYLKERVDNWERFKDDISQLSTGNNVKLTLLEKETYNNLYRIDKLLSSSIIYPRIIGKSARFKNFHEFIDYALEKISSFDVFKGKMELDLQSFKSKVDKIIQALKIKIDICINDAKQIVKNGIKENENIMKDYITGKIFDLQVKNDEFQKKIEKNIDQFNQGLKTFDEKIKLMDEKMEQMMSKNKFSKEKISIYNDINQFKNRYNELNNRINALEKYKLDQEKKHFWEMKAFGQRKKGNNMNISLGFDYMDFNNMENFQKKRNLGIQNNGENIVDEKNNQLKLNLGDDTNRLGSINENENDFNELINDNVVKLNKVILDKNLIASDEDNKEIGKNNNQKNPKKTTKSMRALYKLKVNLNDINAQFNLGSLNTNQNNNSLRDNYNKSLPMATTHINNKYIDFNELLSFNIKNRLKNFFEPKTLRNSVSIKNKELKFFEEEIEPKKARNTDFITEGPLTKDSKRKKREESKKTWERLLSPKNKRKSDLNILDTYFVNFRNLRKNKTLNRMKMSRSSKNFFA